jgi:hypothetical protein
VEAFNGPGTESLVLQPVFPKNFPEVLGLLRQLDPTRSADGWRPLFDYAWRRSDEPVGYELRQGREVVGYLGTVLSQMTIDGRTERFCNVTSWVTRDTHRGQGALLVLQLRRLRGYTITNLTLTHHAFRVFTRLGFKTLDDAWTVIPPNPLLAPAALRTKCRLLFNPEEIRPLLGVDEARILEDHLPYARHLLVVTSEGMCYVVFTIRSRWKLPSARIHYLSDKTIFERCWPRIHHSMLGRYGTVFAEAASQILSGIRIAGSFRKQMRAPRLFRSTHLSPEQVNDLYTEIVLLGVG